VEEEILRERLAHRDDEKVTLQRIGYAGSGDGRQGDERPQSGEDGQPGESGEGGESGEDRKSRARGDGGEVVDEGRS